ncbi:hypothetical protein [Paenibacillus sp. MMO-177]|uniref:hypothetical protein n=1 Tax=Paenibacillus sp. MMO-177 TaxID=3081289 RepID=UPI0030161CFA
MNIGQLVKGLLGESSGTGDTRKLELKPGQVVRGVVLQLLENNEATVQINGVQVRAFLELPLEPGKFAMLQVQPQSAGGLLVLKQVENQAGLEDALKDWLKQSGLPDQEWASNILKDLRKDGVTMSRDTFASLKAAAGAMPQGADAEQWMQAAAAGLKRGLPMSGGTIGALQQVMFGRPAHELLDTLQQQLAAIAGGSTPQALPQLAARLAALLAEGAALQSAAATAEQPPATAAPQAPAAAGAGAAAQRAEGTGAGGQAAPAAAAQASAAEPAEQGAEPQGARPGVATGGSGTAASGNWLGQMMKWMGVDYENQLSKQLPVPPAQGAVQPQEQDASMAVSGNSNDSGIADDPTATRSPNGSVDAPTRQQPAEGRSEARQSSNTQQAAGQQPDQADAAAPHEKEQRAVHNERSRELQLTPQLPTTDRAGSADEVKPAAQESLKSTLLAIAASSEAPPGLRETAQQLVQQITGQQLMLSPERNGAVFSHLTMFVPLKGPDGNQTASVHIQTRRGRQGQLDAENCRLLFDLSMKTLGPTLVDVNVMDKIVSLTLWNDHPAIAALVDSSRTEIAASLNQAGYQLLSLRATPTRTDGALGEGVNRIMPDPAQFVNTRYKGVDIRA